MFFIYLFSSSNENTRVRVLIIVQYTSGPDSWNLQKLLRSRRLMWCFYLGFRYVRINNGALYINYYKIILLWSFRYISYEIKTIYGPRPAKVYFRILNKSFDRDFVCQEYNIVRYIRIYICVCVYNHYIILLYYKIEWYIVR